MMRRTILIAACLLTMFHIALAQNQSQYLSIRVLTTSGSTVERGQTIVEIEGASLGTTPPMHLEATTDSLSVARFRIGDVQARKFRITKPNLCSADEIFSRDEIVSRGVIARAKDCDLHIKTTLHAKPGELIVFAKGSLEF